MKEITTHTFTTCFSCMTVDLVTEANSQGSSSLLSSLYFTLLPTVNLEFSCIC